MNKRVLVTGSNGQLGKSIQKIVLETENNIDFVFANRNSLDITNVKSVNTYFKNNSFNYCINCAAYTAVDKAEEEKEQAFLINAEAVKILAETCKEYKVVLIHISTDFVFDGLKNEPYIETDLTNPINVYGASKLQGEKFIQDILDAYYIIRTSWVYSEFGNNFVKTMLRLAIERDEISVVNDQIGCPTYATDLAGFILYIIQSSNTDFGVYHYCNEGELSWYEFAKNIICSKQLNCRVNPILSVDYNTHAMRPKYSVLKTNKTFSRFEALKPKKVKSSLKKCLQAL